MKKLYNELIKNIKIMFRNWTTISLLIIAPLLLILLIGYSFGNESFNGIKIGFIDKTIDEDYNKYLINVTNEYLALPSEQQFNDKIENFRNTLEPISENLSEFGEIVIYPLISECESDLKTNDIHLCIVLEGINLNEKSNSNDENHTKNTLSDIKTGKVTYYYDNTRKKVSTALIQEMQNYFGLKSEQIGIEASQGIIENIQELISFINDRKSDISKIKNESEGIKLDLIKRKEELIIAREEFLPAYETIKKLQFEINNYSTKINKTTMSLVNSIEEKSEDTINNLKESIIILDSKNDNLLNIISSNFNRTNTTFNYTYSTTDKIDELKNILILLKQNISEFLKNNNVSINDVVNYTEISNNYTYIPNNSIEYLNKYPELENITRIYSNLSINESLEEIKKIDNLISNIDGTELYEKELNDTVKKFTSDIEHINYLVQNTTNKINDIVEKIDLIKNMIEQEIERTDIYISKIDSAVSEIDKLEKDLDSKLSGMINLDKGLGEKIINPIIYNYETILKDSKNIQISFPFLCVMIIMFISMLFSNISTLIEINDKSYLRNIIAPVRNRTYFFGMFITSSLIVFFQIMILFFVAQLKFGVNVINVFPKLMFITYILISVFILIGMCFAYISKSIQSSILITTFFALILFIFANTIAPLETMPTIARNIAEYNPLIIGEFIIKSVQLFNMPVIFLLKDIFILVIYIIILMSLTLYLSKKKSESRD